MHKHTRRTTFGIASENLFIMLNFLNMFLAVWQHKVLAKFPCLSKQYKTDEHEYTVDDNDSFVEDICDRLHRLKIWLS